MKIVHNDLKPENILLSVYKGTNNDKSNSNLSINFNSKVNNVNPNTSDINNANNTTALINKKILIKIADFGSACSLKLLQNKFYIQSRYYRAPESILFIKKKTEKIDIWSIGCILAELYLGTPLMPGNTSYDQLNKINILIGECPQSMIENSVKKDVYFKKDHINYNYRIKKPEEFFKDYPDIPKKQYEIPYNMKSIDDLINVKKDTIKSKNSLYKSMHNSSLSINSSINKEDLVAFIHLIKGMLQVDPNKRWSCSQCLKHPFLTKEKLDKFISFERNVLNQLKSNSMSNNSFNHNNNNWHSMIMNTPVNKLKINKGNYINTNINQNNSFYGTNINLNNQKNYSFGNFNTPYFNNNMPIPSDKNFFNNINMNNNYNNNFQLNNNNFNNQKLNSSFSFNNNYMNNNIYPYNLFLNRMPPYPNNVYFNGPNYNPYNNPNTNNPNNIYFNNNPYIRQSKSFIGFSNEKLNKSFNCNMNKNNNRQNPFTHKSKKNVNPNEFFFKGNLRSENNEDNKKDTENKEENTGQENINN